MRARVAVAVLVVAGSGCGGGQPVGGGGAGSGTSAAAPHKPHVKPSLLWSFDPDSYFSEHDFHEGSAFSPELAVLCNIPWHSTGGSVGLVGLDAKTGAVLWRKTETGWLLHPPDATEPLWFAPEEEPQQYVPAFTKLERLDPRTGKVMATVALDRVPEADYDIRIVWSPRAALVILDDTLTAFDWTTGKALWHATVSRDAYLFAPLVRGDRLYLPDKSNLVVSLVDGAQIAAVPGECCTAIGSPDGKHVFMRAAVDAMAEIATDGSVVRRIAGEVVAASDDYYAVELTVPVPPGGTKTTAIYAYDRDQPVLTLVPSGADDFFTAVALSGSYLYYFHEADATLSQVDLRRPDHREVVDTVGEHLVVSTEVVGTSPAYMGTPPIIERPYLFTEEWGIHGYLIGDE